MSNQKPAIDPETVLATLNQVTQTIEVLSSVVARLQKYVQTNMPAPTELASPVDHSAETRKKMVH
ncbi:MAG TPA: hypothetical protein PLF22_09785 [Pseudomonadales bacterium]|nr:hypothetical protein [Pseudomonadales bacterium]